MHIIKFISLMQNDTIKVILSPISYHFKITSQFLCETTVLFDVTEWPIKQNLQFLSCVFLAVFWAMQQRL